MKYQIDDKIIYNGEELTIIKLGEIYHEDNTNETDPFLLAINSEGTEFIVYIKDLEKQDEEYFTEITDILKESEKVSVKVEKEIKKAEIRFDPQPNAYINADEYEGHLPVSLVQKNKAYRVNRTRRIKQTLAVRNSSKVLSMPVKETKEFVSETALPKIGQIVDAKDNNFVSEFDETTSLWVSKKVDLQAVEESETIDVLLEEQNAKNIVVNSKCGNTQICYKAKWRKVPLCKYHSENFEPKTGVATIRMKRAKSTLSIQQSERNFYDEKTKTVVLEPRNSKEDAQFKLLAKFIKTKQEFARMWVMLAFSLVMMLAGFIALKVGNYMLVNGEFNWDFILGVNGKLLINLPHGSTLNEWFDFILNILLVTVFATMTLYIFIEATTISWETQRQAELINKLNKIVNY
ncbi:hypothetical protein [Mesoplasma seiffertii]|uniref:hypothetical protein n=1 Tax=Mesoplasma seiffertii TaxID=28224 RepID=UPI000478ACB4|nr:hypothetical protein [Mesoplasma seiffertii]